MPKIPENFSANSYHFSEEFLEEAARECLTQPSDSAMWDRRLYSTHGAVLSWAERGDDILAESNYLKVLEFLEGVASGEEENGELDYVIDATTSHWAVGSLRQLFVRVFDAGGDYTMTFCHAADIALGLRDEYPVFDEDDFSEREFKAWEESVRDALDDAVRDWENARDEDRDYINEDANVPELTTEQEDMARAATQEIYEQDGDNYNPSGGADYAEVSRIFASVVPEILAGRWEQFERLF